MSHSLSCYALLPAAAAKLPYCRTRHALSGGHLLEDGAIQAYGDRDHATAVAKDLGAIVRAVRVNRDNLFDLDAPVMSAVPDMGDLLHNYFRTAAGNGLYNAFHLAERNGIPNAAITRRYRLGALQEACIFDRSEDWEMLNGFYQDYCFDAFRDAVSGALPQLEDHATGLSLFAAMRAGLSHLPSEEFSRWLFNESVAGVIGTDAGGRLHVAMLDGSDIHPPTYRGAAEPTLSFC